MYSQNLRLILLDVLRTQQSGCYTNSSNAKTANGSSSCLPLCAVMNSSLFPLSRPSSSHQCPLGPPFLLRKITAVINLLDSGKLAPRTDWLERSVTTTNTKTSPPRVCESNLATWRSLSRCPEQNSPKIISYLSPSFPTRSRDRTAVNPATARWTGQQPPKHKLLPPAAAFRILKSPPACTSSRRTWARVRSFRAQLSYAIVARCSSSPEVLRVAGAPPPHRLHSLFLATVSVLCKVRSDLWI